MNIDRYKKTWIAIATVSAAMLIFAIADQPYDYYQLMRIVVFVSSIFGSVYFYGQDKLEWVWAFVVIGLTFNPFYTPVLEQGTWRILNMVGALVFSGSLLLNSGVRN